MTEILIVSQILVVTTENVWRIVWRIYMLMLGLTGLSVVVKDAIFSIYCHAHTRKKNLITSSASEVLRIAGITYLAIIHHVNPQFF